MAVRFIPSGNLDVNTDPSRLPGNIVEGVEISGAMTRCTNLDVDNAGVAKTRRGSSKVNSTALDQTTPHLIIEMSGDRCVFAGTKAYWNESEIASGLTSARWSAIKYNSYNAGDLSVFAVNGTDRKRITNRSTVTSTYNYAYAHTWEAAQVSGTTYQFGTTRSSRQCWYDWEEGISRSVDDSVVPRRYLWFFEDIIVHEWGLSAPTKAPALSSQGNISGGTLSGNIVGYAYMHLWEGKYHTTREASFQFGQMRKLDDPTQPAILLDQYVFRNRVNIDEYTYKIEYQEDNPITRVERVDPNPFFANVFDPFRRFQHTSEAFTWVIYQCSYDWELTKQDADSTTKRCMWQFERESSYSITSKIGVKYTYCRKHDGILECESNPSPAEYTESLSMIRVWWAQPTDPQVTHVRVYRTLAGATTFFLADEFEVQDKWGTTSREDSDLGSAVATDHNRPPKGGVVAGPTYNGYCFMLKGNRLYFCKPNQPEYWPESYYIECGPITENLKGIELFNGVPYCASTEEVYMIQGSGHDSFFPFPMKAKAGTLDDPGMRAVAGFGVFHSDVDGVYVFAANEDKEIAEDRFGPLFLGETKGSLPGLNRANAANCWIEYFDNRLWYGYPASGATYPNNMIVINLTNGKGRHYQFSQEFGSVAVDGENNRLLALDSTGFVRVLDDSSVTTDAGTAISWQIQSKDYVDQLYKYFPRAAKYDVELGSGATATASILLSDSVIQTHSITSSRNTRKRLVDGKNGDRLGIRIAGSGTVTIREAEVQ